MAALLRGNFCMDSFDALGLAEAWKGTTESPKNLKTWQSWEARCWLDGLTKVELYDRYNEVCRLLNLWASRAHLQPWRKEECRREMLPLAYEALAIYKVL